MLSGGQNTFSERLSQFGARLSRFKGWAQLRRPRRNGTFLPILMHDSPTMGEVFANPMVTASATDRIVHHSVILEFDVPSYRINVAQNRQTDRESDRQKWLTCNTSPLWITRQMPVVALRVRNSRSGHQDLLELQSESSPSPMRLAESAMSIHALTSSVA